ncbi:MlaD family protein [Nocardia abscessus]|jgi:phospholipid/cholesterol/gamma-HCH transport system substrate-binding protein|uniref:MlaD family protein n=1 Tax=Nocardia TaxID=1817 RepID=UPI001893989C|nr:MlaD family protein [Nocardia abscessus]MBF6472644.1 MCE family protein [Nocardia abscessus]
MINRTVASVLGMALIAGGSFGYMYEIGMPVDALHDLNTVKMSLPDTNGVVVGSPVLLRGVHIGAVSRVVSSADRIEVEWKFDKKHRVPLDSNYRVDNLSALGETYIAVTPVTEEGPHLADHSVIDTGKVVVPTTIKELSARLTRLLEQVDPDQVRAIFHEMDVALPQDAQVLDDLNRAGRLLASMITTQSGAFTKLLTAIQTMLQDSSWIGPDLSGAGPVVPKMGRSFSDLWDLFAFIKNWQPMVAANRDGTVPFVSEVQKFTDENAADLLTLGVTLLPAAQNGAASLKTIDVGRLLDEALAAADSEGSVTVHVPTPGR